MFDLNFPPQEIRRTINSLIFADDRKKTYLLEEVKAAADELINIHSLEEITSDNFREALRLCGKKKCGRLQYDLVNNNLSDTYFLPPCGELIPSPSVVMLRYIYTCPVSLFDIRKAEDNICTPERILRLKSPFIESLMSKFAALFLRVGTRDIPEAMVSAFSTDLFDGGRNGLAAD